VPVTGDFWATIDRRTDLHGGRLVTVSHFRDQRDWPHAEMHPAGDERRQACVVPRGVWHHCIVREPSVLLGVTRGAGTLHRER
jgi:hypothetical protein